MQNIATCAIFCMVNIHKIQSCERFLAEQKLAR